MNSIEVGIHCGSPMCHGGWYIVAKRNLRQDNSYGHPFSFSFSDGSYLMATDLGFSSEEDYPYGSIEGLEKWARGNPEIWGNEYGVGMFAADEAFTGDPKIKVTDLQQIIDHWEGVRDRLKAIEEDAFKFISTEGAI